MLSRFIHKIVQLKFDEGWPVINLAYEYDVIFLDQSYIAYMLQKSEIIKICYIFGDGLKVISL